VVIHAPSLLARAPQAFRRSFALCGPVFRVRISAPSEMIDRPATFPRIVGA
jgi:hypothetical protein